MSETVEIPITFPGGKRVDIEVFGQKIRTDQSPRHGGDGGAPEPFDLFLASIGTCAGIYVLGFLQSRNLPTEDLKLIQRLDFDPETKLLRGVDLDIEVPGEVPEKYHAALRRAAEKCTVKRTIQAQPEFRVGVRTLEKNFA